MGLASFLTGDEDPNKAWDQVGPAPDVGSQQYTPETQNAQTYSAQQVGSNAMAGANGDQGAQSAQREALDRLQQTAQGGMNASDRAALYDAQQSQAEQNRGQQQAITQQAAERGALNSGSALAAQLSANQSSQEAGARAGADAAGQAANRALAANSQAGDLAGNMNQQAFMQQATRGAAQNQINENNANMANRASEFNANAGNEASRFNIGNSIEAKRFLAQLMQQKYRNQMDLAAGKSGTSLGQEGMDMGALQSVVGAGGQVAAAALAHGGKIEGQAPVAGDSPKNDVVPAMLSPGEIVLPRSVVGSPDKIIAFLEEHAGIHFGNVVKGGQKKK